MCRPDIFFVYPRPLVPVDASALKQRQRELAKRVRHEDDLGPVETLAAFDVAYDDETGVGALVVADGDGAIRETLTASVEVDVPYVPGLLAFRELPVLKALWSDLDEEVDLLLVDGGGKIHPRRIGSASHAGVVLEVPSVGVTKSLLLGEVQDEVAEVGDVAPIRDDRELVGYALHTCHRAKHPIYVSPGHRVTAETALELVEPLCSGRSRLPDPLQAADRTAARAKQER